MTHDRKCPDFPFDGYTNVRRLPNGEWIGTQGMLFTTGLFVGLDAIGYRTRFCYEHEADAVGACRTWDGNGDPPGMWIKEKPSNRLNPNWSKATTSDNGRRSCAAQRRVCDR